MRLIGHLQDEARARAFSDYLYAQDIDNQVEAEEARWAVWVHAEDQLDNARQLLEAFRQDPADRKYAKASRLAREKRERALEEAKVAQKRYFDRSVLFPSRVLRLGGLTAGLMIASGVITLLTAFGDNSLFPRLFSFAPFSESGGYITFRQHLDAIPPTQPWRLMTPIFVHMSLLHLLFNLLWLKDLGSLIESRLGPWHLLGLVTLIALPSNAAQFLLSGPAFGGLSGVVYGLLGYVWVRSRLNPESGLFIDPLSVTIMAVWYALCLFGVIAHVANTVHTVGLAMGLLAGFLAARVARRR